MSQNQAQVQIFEIVDGDFKIDVEKAVNTFKELAQLIDMHEIKKEYEKKTSCEYTYDEHSIVHDVAKFDDVEVYDEDAIDVITCYYNEFTAEIYVKMLRLVAVKENEFRLLAIKAIETLGIRISREEP